jgi:transposase-like protein
MPGVSSDERDELVRLRRERRVLRMERDLLSRAAAFFADAMFAFIDAGVSCVPRRLHG